MRNVTVQEKEYALNNAVASVEMEGYSISETERRLCMDVLNGNLTKTDFIQILLERCSVYAARYIQRVYKIRTI